MGIIRGFLLFSCCLHDHEETKWEIGRMEPPAAIVGKIS